MKSYNDLLPDFLSDRKLALSGVTYRGYESKFKVISAWLRDKNLDSCPLKSISKDNIYHFFNHLAIDKGLDKTTCEKYLISLKLFYKFASKRVDIGEMPFDLVTLPQKKEGMGAKVIGKNDMEKLMNLTQKSKKQLYLAMMFEYYSALRPGNEIRLLKVGEVDKEAGVIRIDPRRAKSRREDIVTIPKQLAALYKEYLDSMPYSVSDDMYVFGRNGKVWDKPWSANTLRNQFNKYRDELGISNKVKFYSAKHTGLTRLAESGLPMHYIMEHARHTNLSTTQRYIKRHGGIINKEIQCNFPNPA